MFNCQLSWGSLILFRITWLSGPCIQQSDDFPLSDIPTCKTFPTNSLLGKTFVFLFYFFCWTGKKGYYHININNISIVKQNWIVIKLGVFFLIFSRVLYNLANSYLMHGLCHLSWEPYTVSEIKLFMDIVRVSFKHNTS